MSIEKIAKNIISCQGEFNLAQIAPFFSKSTNQYVRRRELELIEEVWENLPDNEKMEIEAKIEETFNVDKEIEECETLIESTKEELDIITEDISKADPKSTEFEDLLYVYFDLKASLKVCEMRLADLHSFNLEAKYFKI